MNELIPIKTDQDGNKTVSARKLYDYLGYNPTHWKRWYTKNIEEDDMFIENIDYQTFAIMANGNTTVDFDITIDMAKELSMLARNEKGKEARRYFIACEKVVQKVKQLSPAEFLVQQAQMLLEQEKRLSKIEDKVLEIEAKTTTTPEFYTIAGYGTILGVHVNLQLASRLGKKATTMCNRENIETGKINDPRWGTVKTYPKHILHQVFEQPLT